MPNQPKTPLQNVRVERALWDEFGEVADPDRSAVIRAFIAWYVREPGAKLPRRPEVSRTDGPDHAAERPHSAA